MSKLHFASEGTKTTVYLYNGEAWSDENKQIVDSFETDAAALPDEFKAGDKMFSLKEYGLKKILQDRSSDEKDKAVKFAQMKDTYAQLQNGIWREVSEKGESAPRRSSAVDPILVEALVKVTGKTHLQVSAALQGKTKEERKALMEHASIKPVYDALKAEAASASIELPL